MPSIFRSFLLRHLAAFVCLVSLTGPVHAALDSDRPMNPSGFAIQRGTNLSHWLSQDFGWAPRATWITENDLRFIASKGFDHVRLPIDEKELWNEDGTRNADAFALMRRAVGWARTHGLRIIIDLHTVRSHHFNASNEGMAANTLFTDPREQEHFLGLWRELSSALKDQPVDAVAYEIMNEPVADDPADWNKLVAKAHAAIRELEPDRVLVIGSNRWQIPQTLPQLEVPAGDRNIILSTHTYSPLLFTHYTAEWVPTKIYTGPVKYPGSVVSRQAFDKLMGSIESGMKDLIGNAMDDWGPARLEQELAPAIRRARELGLQLYCGEFGCLPSVPRTDRLAYYRDLIAVFEKNGMAWANWEYKGDFGLFEWHGLPGLIGAPDDELIAALLSQKR